MQRDEIGGFAEDGSPVIGRITSFTPGTMPEAHAHWRGQLAWCPDRPVTVETGRKLHLLSPGMAIWLPPTHRHRIRAEGARQSVSLYTRPAAAPLPKDPTPFPLEALEAELLRALAGSSRADRQEPAFVRLTAVLWDRLAPPLRPRCPCPQTRACVGSRWHISMGPTNRSTTGLGHWRCRGAACNGSSVAIRDKTGPPGCETFDWHAPLPR